MIASTRQSPLTEPTLLILLALWSKPSYGYEIRREIRDLSRGRVKLGNGTVYETLPRLERCGWIRAAPNGTPARTRRERRLYELTEVGRKALRDEQQRLRSLCELLVSRGIRNSGPEDPDPALGG